MHAHLLSVKRVSNVRLCPMSFVPTGLATGEGDHRDQEGEPRADRALKGSGRPLQENLQVRVSAAFE